MASTDITSDRKRPDGPVSPADAKPDDIAGLEAGLDALDAVQIRRTPVREVLKAKVLPPVVAVALVLIVWELLVRAEVTEVYKLPPPSAVWDSAVDMWLKGTLLEVVWTSVSRGLLGFLLAVAIGTPLGLLVARVKLVRAAIGPILSGLQSLPSVAWVAPAVIWLGLNDSMMYAVILLGAVPSIANGLVSGVDQVPPLFLRAGRTLGATGIRGTWHIVLPAALPGYLAGLKQGWAFSWRSLMAAEIIASSPELGLGLGQLLENGRSNFDMPGVFLSILLILFVGIAIDLLIFSPLERWVLRSRGLLVKN
ncbi:ABC transporter permease [Streptomyces bacillaris]|uniref:ABC transporter permease n=1 Tax=Streptomyces cavourensis TaxID=67258 RepID=A0AAD0Q962_9ACTN|nr:MULTISPECIES: ABC transporter permease [Streptomyces]NUW24373.1 ABC transporter permease [Streptomyces roseoviolaceus]ALC26690.1 sulfate ABC transporter permease [Streptomyces sp. CFMR 7]ATY98863.1 ABC transporter permease [Streptomyces cavourensis]AXI74716.1 ABC transporter permease [Streptomyces cavourensis]MBH0245119.1 ABC transporter permease [Streptomyces cavourensis]